ncbi:transposase [Streptomyces sp. NPDC057909]|uniref:IS110 family transposase n=1 Tax=Streptomyces sp. NPDC057909 TaxID=3346277 RepID=UPI0036EBEF3F
MWSVTVVDVSPSTPARVRQLSRSGGHKNDCIDAAALQDDARPVQPEDSMDALALLDERRSNLAQARGRAVNQLQALLRGHRAICPQRRPSSCWSGSPLRPGRVLPPRAGHGSDR